ncbi:A-kinase anchor protein 9-like [Sinocyclocheilus grahami]|uniref:A-kinase anchor protein 9-like n=1 Tax=Sinocyclocheilus grahami TaxID=75366 RepID=UPI0007ACCDA1|nr:PREDICTED: A-kinase anchor protein 9-like [Sinocyclocheilus grahami]
MTGFLSAISFLPVHKLQTREEEEEEETKVRGQRRAVDPQLSSDVLTTERDVLRKANTRLRQALTDVLKTTAAAEETIGRHVEGILEAGPARVSKQSFSSRRDVLRKANTRLRQALTDVLKTTAAAEETIGRHVEGILEAGPAREGFHDDLCMFSAETETGEGLEVLLRIEGAELQLQEAELPLEREEFLMSIGTRLQSAVEKLLITITETSTQLEHAEITQTELMREKFRHNEEMGELQRRQEELQERLCEEERAREQLALELHKAEGLIDGYTGERLALEQQVREHAELQMHLEQELTATASRLRELEQERQQIQDERELLSRQHDAMREGAGPRELHLLEETEKLMAEKVEVQRQAQKESGELLQQVKQLEAELEEQVSRLQELQETHSAETADLRQQIQALEKQLEKNRKFMDVQELSAALQQKADWCSELRLSSEQLQRDVCERDEEIETLGARVRELEHTLMHRVVRLLCQ